MFERIWDIVKHEPRPAIHMEKQLGWVHESGGTESQGISGQGQENSVSQVNGVSDMVPACQLCGSGGSVQKRDNGL